MITNMKQVATMSFFCFEGFSNRRWAMKQMYETRAKMKKLDGLQFFKLLGTGGKDGYSLWPDFGVYAVLAVWETHEKALSFKETVVFRNYLAHSKEQITFYLSPVSARGSWSGFKNWQVNPADPENPFICAITRAAIKLSYIPKFWSMVSGISDEHQKAEGVLFSKGVGEYPFFEQATFTIWKDIGSMNDFARRNLHLEAIKVTRERDGFSEEMFNRFQIVGVDGSWSGFELK
jgi:spheroidene monooxygenase